MSHWPIILPMDIFCTEFHTSLSFGTKISFGYLRQYFCVQLTNVIPGKDGKVKLTSQLIYKPLQPGAPDGLSQMCDYKMKKKSGEEYQPDPAMEKKMENEGGSGLTNTCAMLTTAKELLPDNLPGNQPNILAMLGAQVVVQQLPDFIITDPRPDPKYPPVPIMKMMAAESPESEEGPEMNMTDWHVQYDGM